MVVFLFFLPFYLPLQIDGDGAHLGGDNEKPNSILDTDSVGGLEDGCG